MKTALVTGASSGIGLCITQVLLGQGWQVIGLSRRAPEGLGDRFRHIALDLSEPQSLDRALSGIAPPDAVIHAAGLLRVGALGNFDHEDGARMWHLHVDTAARLLGGLAPKMPDGSRFVMIGSRVANGAANRALYAASKSALTGLVRSVAEELAPRGITVNIVAPGATDTPMLRDPARLAEAPKMPPIGRMIQPEEVAETVAFLLSRNAGAITGQTLIICGGASL